MKSSVAKETKLLAKHSIIYGFGTILNSSVAILMLPIYTRFLTPTDYGIKELLGLTVDVIGILLAAAIASATYRFYFEYEEIKDRNEVISTAIISLGSFGLFSIFLLSFTTRFMARYILDSSEYYYFFLIAFASMWFNAMINIGYNYLRANQKSIQFLAFSSCKLILALSLNIYFVAIVKLGVLGILVSNLISSILIFLSLVLPLIVRIGLKFSPEKIKGMLKFGLPVIPAQLGSFVVHLSGRFFIKAFFSLADTGLYSLAYRFGTLPNTFITSPFNQIWFPRRLEIYKNEDSERLFGQIFTYFCFILFFAGLAISILTKDVLMIMADPKFWSAYKIVPIIVIAITIFSFHYHFHIGIVIYKKTKYFAYIDGSNALLVLILNFFLIKKYGIWGAAFVTLIAFIYKVSLTYILSSKLYKIYFEFRRLLKMTIVAFILYGICYSLEIQHVWLSFLFKSLIICTFPIILYFIEFFTKEEMSYVKGFIQSKRIRILNGFVKKE